MATYSPPARYYKLCPPLCWHSLKMTDRGVGWITTEGILLEVGSPEDHINKNFESKDDYDRPKWKVYWVID